MILIVFQQKNLIWYHLGIICLSHAGIRLLPATPPVITHYTRIFLLIQLIDSQLTIKILLLVSKCTVLRFVIHHFFTVLLFQSSGLSLRHADFFCTAVPFSWALSTHLISTLSFLLRSQNFRQSLFLKLSWKIPTNNLSPAWNAYFQHCLLLYPLWSVPYVPCSPLLISSSIFPGSKLSNFSLETWQRFSSFLITRNHYLLEEKNKVRQTWMTSEKLFFFMPFSILFIEEFPFVSGLSCWFAES